MTLIEQVQQSSRHPRARDLLLGAFQKLSTVGGVVLTQLDPANKKKWVMNFRTFVMEVRAVVMVA